MNYYTTELFLTGSAPQPNVLHRSLWKVWKNEARRPFLFKADHAEGFSRVKITSTVPPDLPASAGIKEIPVEFDTGTVIPFQLRANCIRRHGKHERWIRTIEDAIVWLRELSHRFRSARMPKPLRRTWQRSWVKHPSPASESSTGQ